MTGLHQVSFAAVMKDFLAMRFTRPVFPLAGAAHSNATPANGGRCSPDSLPLSARDDPVKSLLCKKHLVVSPLQ